MASVIFRAGDRILEIPDTFENRLWTARLLVGESENFHPDYASILWTLIRRFLWSSHRYPSWVAFLRLFAQSINPRWLPGGDLYAEAIQKNLLSASDRAVQRRKKFQSMPWDVIPKIARDTVDLFFRGELIEPPATLDRKTTNFAAWDGIERVHPRGVSMGSKNWFFNDRIGSPIVVPRGGGLSGSIGLGLAALFF